MKKTCTETQLREWIAAGETAVDIAKRLGRSHGAVSSTCTVLGIGARRGARPNPSFDRAAAFEMVKVGTTLTEIAKGIGITRQAVYNGLRSAGYPTSAAQYLRQQAQQSA